MTPTKHGHQRLTDEQLLKRLAPRRDVRFLHGQKWKIVLIGGLAAGPFATLPLLLIFLEGSRQVWIPLLLVLLNLGWSLTVGWGHRPISWQAFKELSPPMQERRLYYESFWMYFYEGGLASFVPTVLMFCGAMICFDHNWYPGGAVLLGAYLAALVLAFVRRHWLVQLFMEGFKQHPELGAWMRVLVGLVVAVPILNGLGRLLAVTRGQDYAIAVMGPLLLVVLWVLSATTGVLAIPLFLTTRLCRLAYKDRDG